MVAANPVVGLVPFLHRVDPHGRPLRKLRISITEACNFRCLYCMEPEQLDPPSDGLLPPREIRRLAGVLVDLGVEAIRLTGGEPTVRLEFGEIVRSFGDLVADKGLTTNGHRLEAAIPDLLAGGFRSVNVSLDSLESANFRRIARSGDLGRVLDGIRAAREAGLRVKVNCVVMKGVNDHEIPAFHDFSAGTGIEVRFLEMMRIGPARALQSNHFLSTKDIIDAVERHAGALDPLPVAADSTVFRKRSRAGAVLGFMGSETDAFCGTCSRLRLSARGVLHPCLFREDGTDLRGASEAEIRERIRAVAPLKPLERLPDIARPMHRIGG